MNEIFYRKIEDSTAHRPIRDFISAEVIANSELFPHLLTVAFDVSDKNHHKACWILELVIEAKIDWLYDYLDRFTATLPLYSHDGAIRSISKICMFSAEHHIQKTKKQACFISEKQLQQITETCFDWLIDDRKVASKAYAIRTLFQIGKLYDWIYPELKFILTKDYPNHTAAYKAVAREVLKKIK